MGDYVHLPGPQGPQAAAWMPQHGYPSLFSAPYAPQQPIYPVNPAAYPLLQPIPVARPQDFGPAVVYFVLIVLILGLGTADLGFTHWVHYCGLEVGLLQHIYGDSAMYLHDAVDFFCIIPLEFDGCGETCHISRLLYKAGIVTFSLCVASLSALLLSLLFLAVLLCKPRWSLLGYSARGALALGGFLWAAGTVTYWAYFAVVKGQARYTEIGTGLGLAGVTGGLVLLACVVGMVAVSKVHLSSHPH